MRRKTTEEFIAEAKATHGDKYDYSKTQYVDSSTDICIVCPEHGEFWQRPYNHIKGCGCQQCAGFTKWTNERLIKEGRAKYGNRFDYSQVEVKDGSELVVIKCKECGTKFRQAPKYHISGLQGGCPTCRYRYVAEGEKISFDEFKKRAESRHGGGSIIITKILILT